MSPRSCAAIASLAAFAGICAFMAYIQRKASHRTAENIVEFPSVQVDGQDVYFL